MNKKIVFSLVRNWSAMNILKLMWKFFKVCIRDKLTEKFSYKNTIKKYFMEKTIKLKFCSWFNQKINLVYHWKKLINCNVCLL